MKTFNKLNKVKTLIKDGKKVIIFKYGKEGTSRIFFAPEINDRRITSTMWVRKYDAINLAKKYLFN